MLSLACDSLPDLLVPQGAFTPAPGLQPSIPLGRVSHAPAARITGDTSDSLGLSYLIRAYQVQRHLRTCGPRRDCTSGFTELIALLLVRRGVWGRCVGTRRPTWTLWACTASAPPRRRQSSTTTSTASRTLIWTGS